ncbi:4-hydroxyphenylacetate 3-monooxygenase reductase component [Ephemeroptericola cinctiostellae]|uniref:4-hydroxyphenylacetate 3-monooxygenase reductase component n=1 Tax=Ephemeroptericola cinctiostellae TaxID=2268024 RepID=A0A345DCB3_9BURK|nr:flavin reductase [Ephemeroptericola cinctiostellae]AXF86001.1 4-hydroxyphenylacetate 3-monooxygenase reductase component [Ephemeroptericola cinctiostellae]
MQDMYEALQKQFRESMARLGSSVCIVTTKGDAGLCGMTVSAVCSVTDTPATVMVCINRKSAMNAVFKANGHMGINVLNAQQKDVAMQFSGKTDFTMEQRFASDDWEHSTRLPRLKNAAATLNGDIIQTVEMGTHTIFFVTIARIYLDENPSALVYFNRQFHELA